MFFNKGLCFFGLFFTPPFWYLLTRLYPRDMKDNIGLLKMTACWWMLAAYIAIIYFSRNYFDVK